MLEPLNLIAEFIACIAAIFTFTRLSVGYKIVAVHAIVTFIIEFAGLLLRTYGKHCHFTIFYHPFSWNDISTLLYDGYLLFDYVFLVFAAYLFGIKFPAFIYVIISSFISIAWIYDVYTFKTSKPAFDAYLLDSIILVGIYSWLLYNTAFKHRGSLLKSPVLWFCLGIILFYGCNIPFFAMLNYLIEMKAFDVMKQLLDVLKILVVIRYLFISTGLILYYYQNKKY